MNYLKKAFSFILFIGVFSITIVLTSIEVQATYHDGVENHLGFGVNVATAKGISQDIIKDRIYTSTWLNHPDQKPQELLGSGGKYYSIQGFDETEILTQLELQMDFGAGVTGVKGPFSMSAAFHYGSQIGYDYSQYNGNFFNKTTYIHKLNGLRFNDCFSNTSKYAQWSSFSSGFKSHILRMQTNGASQYEMDSFFESFGTHMVCKAYYGGRADLYTSVVSSNTNFNNSIKANINNYFSASGPFRKIASGDISTDYSLSTMTGLSTSQVQSDISLDYQGGEAFDVSDIIDFRNNINSWKNTINHSNKDLVDFGDNSLLPLWEIIDEFDTYLASQIEDYYYEYLQNHYDESKSEIEVKVPNKSQEIIVYDSDPKTVTDSGWQDTVRVDWSDLGLDIEKLKSSGYTKFYIETAVYMKEVNRGYQRVGIFENSYSTSPLRYEEREYGGGGKPKSSWGWQDFDEPSPISIDKLNSTYFAIKFVARGSLEDDWQYKKVKIVVTFEK